MEVILLTQIFIFFWNMIRVTEEDILLFKRRSRLDIRKYVLGNKVTDKWNNLPQCCINCTTSNNFKSHIRKVLEPKTK